MDNYMQIISAPGPGRLCLENVTKSLIFRFKRSTDASFFIFDLSPSIRKASSDITSAHSKRFWKNYVISEECYF